MCIPFFPAGHCSVHRFAKWWADIDSTVLAYVMKTLNERYQYGLDLFLLSIDEGITGYRDDSLEVRCYLSSTGVSTYHMFRR